MTDSGTNMIWFRLTICGVYWITTSLYFRFRKAPRRLYVWNFIVSIAVLAFSFLDITNVIRVADSVFAEAVLLLITLAVFGSFCYRLKSLATFLLYAAGLAFMFAPFYLDDFLRGRGVSPANLSVFGDAMLVTSYVFFSGSAIQGFRAHFSHRRGES